MAQDVGGFAAGDVGDGAELGLDSPVYVDRVEPAAGRSPQERISGRRPPAEVHFGSLQIPLRLPHYRRHERHVAHLVSFSLDFQDIAFKVKALDVERRKLGAPEARAVEERHDEPPEAALVECPSERGGRPGRLAIRHAGRPRAPPAHLSQQLEAVLRHGKLRVGEVALHGLVAVEYREAFLRLWTGHKPDRIGPKDPLGHQVSAESAEDRQVQIDCTGAELAVLHDMDLVIADGCRIERSGQLIGRRRILKRIRCILRQDVIIDVPRPLGIPSDCLDIADIIAYQGIHWQRRSRETLHRPAPTPFRPLSDASACRPLRNHCR